MLWKSIPYHCIPPCTHKRALCFIRSTKGFLFILKLYINQIICDEVRSDGFGSTSQTSSVVKYFISFFRWFHEILTIVSFCCLAQMDIIYLRNFCCNIFLVREVNGSVVKVATYHIHLFHGCYKYWYICEFGFDGFYLTCPWSL